MKVCRWTRDCFLNVFRRKKKKTKTQRITELSTTLETETQENQNLWDQVEFLTKELHRERCERKRQAELYCKEQAKSHREYTLRMELSKQLEKLHNDKQHMESQWELGMLTSAITYFQHALEQARGMVAKTSQMYEAEKKRNAILLHKLEQEIHCHLQQEYKSTYIGQKVDEEYTEKSPYGQTLENMLLSAKANYEEELPHAQGREIVQLESPGLSQCFAQQCLCRISENQELLGLERLWDFGFPESVTSSSAGELPLPSATGDILCRFQQWASSA